MSVHFGHESLGTPVSWNFPKANTLSGAHCLPGLFFHVPSRLALRAFRFVTPHLPLSLTRVPLANGMTIGKKVGPLGRFTFYTIYFCMV